MFLSVVLLWTSQHLLPSSGVVAAFGDLLTVSGPATCKLIWNLSAPQKLVEKLHDELVALVKSHYILKPSVTVQKFQFHSHKQKPGETVAAFVAELQQLSKFCEFVVHPSRTCCVTGWYVESQAAVSSDDCWQSPS